MLKVNLLFFSFVGLIFWMLTYDLMQSIKADDSDKYWEIISAAGIILFVGSACVYLHAVEKGGDK
jgi:hypothetical protein